MQTYTVDAKGKKLGRIASDVAYKLMGKSERNYTPHMKSEVIVKVVNVSELQITDKKREQKMYGKYSGYPGGLQFSSLKETVRKKGYEDIMRKAVYNMLPKNKLRNDRMKQLIISK